MKQKNSQLVDIELSSDICEALTNVRGFYETHTYRRLGKIPITYFYAVISKCITEKEVSSTDISITYDFINSLFLGLATGNLELYLEEQQKLKKDLICFGNFLTEKLLEEKTIMVGNNCKKTEEIKVALSNFFTEKECPEEVLSIINSWFHNYRDFCPNEEFECDLIMDDLINNRFVGMAEVMFIAAFAEKLDTLLLGEGHRFDDLHIELAVVMQFVADSGLHPYL